MPVHGVRRPSGWPQDLALAQSPPAAREKRKEKTTLFGIKITRSQISYQAAQVQHVTSSKRHVKRVSLALQLCRCLVWQQHRYGVSAARICVAAAQKRSNWLGMTSVLRLLGIAATKMPYFSGFELSRTCENSDELMYLEKASVSGILLDL
jgi:hypothetical protein